jgi:hypothetical protein
MTNPADIRDTCAALLALEKVGRPARRRYESWELKALARMYLNEEITLAQMAAELNRPIRSIADMLRRLDVERRRPSAAGEQQRLQRRNDKIIEAAMLGDSWEVIARRWGISDRTVYQILWEYKSATGMTRQAWKSLIRRGGTVKKILLTV